MTTAPKFVKCDKAKIDTEWGMVTYLNCFGIRVCVEICEVIDGKYPDISRIIPKENKPVSEIGCNASYLADIEKAAKIYNPKYKSIKIKPNGNDNAVIVALKKTHPLSLCQRGFKRYSALLNQSNF